MKGTKRKIGKNLPTLAATVPQRQLWWQNQKMRRGSREYIALWCSEHSVDINSQFEINRLVSSRQTGKLTEKAKTKKKKKKMEKRGDFSAFSALNFAN